MTESTTTNVNTSNDDMFKTRFSEVELLCPKCNATWSPPVAVMVNASTDPQAKEGILRGTMHRVRCPACKRHEYEIDQIFDFYDPDEGLLIQFRPRWEFNAGGGEDVYLKRLEALILKYAEHDVRVDVSFGFSDAIEKYFGGEEAVEAAKSRAEQERKERRAYGSIVAEQAAAKAGNNSPERTG
ncbi:MAG TPA: CpXC domain-containing protein [Thermomicrobiales bacterium]|nr:CpXC domain-containing protein [Thermomicrobiales bacterium]